MSMVIRGRVFTEGALRQAAVRVEDGRIAQIAEGDVGEADEVVELEERQTLLPAAVETLAAMRDWGEVQRDTVETVTRGALAAGVTTVCDQANTVPRINTPELVRRRGEHIAACSFTDFAVASHPPRDPAQLNALRAAGANTLQLFSWDLRPWNEPFDTDDSAETFRRFAEAGLSGLIFVDEHALRETPIHEQGELYAVRALLRRLDPDFRVRLYVSLPESVEMIADAKGRLPNVRIVTTLHNLFVSHARGHARIGIAARQFPPLRSDEAVARMQALAEQGAIDIVMSHHAAHRMADKYSSDPVPGELTPKAGYSAIDIAFPLLLTRLGIAPACRLYCEAPGKWLGLEKGVIAPGHDADLAVVEEDAGTEETNIHQTGGHGEGVWKIDPPTMFQSRGMVTPFVGERLRYRVVRTYLRGEVAFDRVGGGFTRRPVRQIV